MIAPKNQWFMPMSLDCLGQTCLAPNLRLARRLQKKKLKERRVDETRSKESSHSCSWELVALYPTLQVFSHISGSFPVFFPGDAETIPGVSGNEDVLTGVETDEELRGRQIVVTRSLVPLAGGPSMMSLRLSTVEVGAGICWSRILMPVIFVFKWGFY